MIADPSTVLGLGEAEIDRLIFGKPVTRTETLASLEVVGVPDVLAVAVAWLMIVPASTSACTTV